LGSRETLNFACGHKKNAIANLNPVGYAQTTQRKRNNQKAKAPQGNH
jgi:hypothetical protein